MIRRWDIIGYLRDLEPEQLLFLPGKKWMMQEQVGKEWMMQGQVFKIVVKLKLFSLGGRSQEKAFGLILSQAAPRAGYRVWDIWLRGAHSNTQSRFSNI